MVDVMTWTIERRSRMRYGSSDEEPQEAPLSVDVVFASPVGEARVRDTALALLPLDASADGKTKGTNPDWLTAAVPMSPSRASQTTRVLLPQHNRSPTLRRTRQVAPGLFHAQEESIFVVGHDQAAHDGFAHHVYGVLDADAAAAPSPLRHHS
ncbi:hypothetical protein ABZX69_40195 [Streptomyces sp. NPDC004074]|uniref:hypothetical protein n=1 Tax=unclassified Streptomyces TaxID=2593676 RepID=UPI0033B870C4